MESEKFPMGPERRKDALAKERLKEEIISKGQDFFEDGHYEWLDSPMDGLRASFQTTFRKVLPGEPNMQAFIEASLAERRGLAVGVEFGGIGSRVFSGFDPGFFKRTIGVALVDHDRNDLLKHHRRTNTDRSRGHEVIEGDIFSADLYPVLRSRLNDEKVDLIMERMVSGLESAPGDPYAIGKILSIWYDLLREQGLLFAQVPVSLNSVLTPWSKMVRDRSDGKVEILTWEGTGDITSLNPSVLRIRKLPGAPEELPLLSPRELRRISKST